MFVTALLSVISATQLPAAVPMPRALRARPIATVLQATHTHFVAENLSLSDQILLFGSIEHGLLAAVPLGALQRVSYPFARGASDDVLTLDDCGYLRQPGSDWRWRPRPYTQRCPDDRVLEDRQVSVS